MKIFTWHIHGSYLYYLSQGGFEIYVPENKEKSEGYIGLGTTFPFGKNVHAIAAEHVREHSFDCILFQTFQNYLHDQYIILSEEQRQLPRIFLQHDPPQGHPTDTRHVVDDPEITIVHVTDFNRLMWDNNGVPTAVIDHGVLVPSTPYSGDLKRGIVVINDLGTRGRRLGLDVFETVRNYIPLDLVGMNTIDIGGLGEVLHPNLPQFISRYRFFFNPIRYTSLGLAVIEAMMTGMPVVGLATTEMVTVFENGVSGYIDTNVGRLIRSMEELLENKELATKIGDAGKKVATERFNIHRFINDWTNLFNTVIRKQILHLEIMN